MSILEDRYFNALKGKYETLLDLYDGEKETKKANDFFAPVPVLATPIIG